MEGVTTDYLPYSSSNNNGSLKANPITDQATFYNNATSGVATDSRPYSEAEYELSPLDRVKKAYGPGSLWKNGSTSKGQEGLVQVNIANTIRRWYINSSTLTAGKRFLLPGK